MLDGIMPAMVTPFDGRGEIDPQATEAVVERCIEAGVDGLSILGSTGEFLSMSREERQLVTETVICTANGRVPVLMGTGAEWTPECVELSKEAEDMGADGVMIIPPFYSCPNEDELFAHYRAVGEAISIPIMDSMTKSRSMTSPCSFRNENKVDLPVPINPTI